MKKMFSKIKATKGFTLVEMIVVMAIIGILVALLAPNVATLIKDAQDTSNDAKVKNVMRTLSAYNTKMIKDGYQFKGVGNAALTQSTDISWVGTSNMDGCVVEVNATNFNDTIQKLWFDNQSTPAQSDVEFVGTSSGYLPANVISGTEKMFIYLTKEGNVLGVIYVDANTYVKAANTTLSFDAYTTGTNPLTGGTGMVSSANVRDMKTADARTFTN